MKKIKQILPKGITVDTWSPGDGVTRYRFVTDIGLGDSSYFGASHNDILVTCLGVKEAELIAVSLKRYAQHVNI